MSQPSEGEQKARNQDSTTAVPTVPTFSISSQSDYIIQGLVNGVAIDVLVDTGAAITVLSIEAWRKVGMKGRLFSTKRKLMGVQGTPLQLHGVANIDLTLEGKVFPVEVTVAETLTTDLILVRDFMKAQQCTIQMGKTQDVLLVKQHGLAIPLTNKDVRPVLSHVDVVLDAAVQLVRWRLLVENLE